MVNQLRYFLILLCTGCSIYNFHSGGSTEGLNTFSVPLFRDLSSLKQPNLNRDFTYLLQDYLSDYTSLKVVTEDGDINYSGEITNYKIEPAGLKSDNTASQNRLTIEVNVRFKNKVNDKKSWEKKFSHYYDYNASSDLEGSLKDDAYKAIFDRILLDIFNASLGW